MNNIKPFLLLAFMVLILPFSVQADDSEFEADDYLSFTQEVRSGPNDPLEGMNRTIHGFNGFVDWALLDPLAETYNYVMPQFAQNRVYDFLENIEAPVVFVNSLLQGDPENVFVTFWRFVLNSTLGVAGLFDIATELGMPERNEEDFGQTLGVWGVGSGPYLVVPLLGPSSLRDLPGRVVDIFINPLTYSLDFPESVVPTAARVIDTRVRLDKYIDQVNNSSLDPYATFRSLYVQRREALVNNFSE